MTIDNSEIKLYVDMMVVESLLDNPSIIKEAGVGDTIISLMGKIKDYFVSKIDPNNKEASILNLIAPGAISILFSALGAPWIGALLALAQQVFKVNVGGMLMSIYETIKGIITGGKQTTSQQVDSAVSNAVSANYTPVTDADEKAVLDKLEKNKSASYDVRKQMRDARIVKLAIIEFQEGTLDKRAWLGGLTFKLLQGKVLSVLIKFLGIIFKIALSSVGFIIAGETINEFVNPGKGKGDSGGGFFSSKTPTAPVSAYVSTQTKFKLNSGYQDIRHTGDSIWTEAATNNINGISDMLVKFAKQVYSGLDGLESLMKNLPTFQEIVFTITDINKTAEGSNTVYLPNNFVSKKQIVDMFIDDLAKKVP